MSRVIEIFQTLGSPLGLEPFSAAFITFILLAAIVPTAMRKYDKEVPAISRAAISGFFIVAAFITSDYIIWASETSYAEMTLPYIDHLVFQVVEQMLGWAVLLTLLILFGLGIVVGSVSTLRRFMNGEFDIDIFND